LVVALGASFAETQNKAARVIAARQHKVLAVKARFAQAGVSYPAKSLYLRVFKRERLLEVWAGDVDLTRVAAYDICASSGELGPKRARGDLQVPEGFYKVDRFNPQSSFHLALGLDYPNAADRKHKRGDDPGGDIFIHGACVTIGCVPIQDEQIEELYLMALDSRALSGRDVVVHVFPGRLDEAGIAALRAHPLAGEHLSFWQTLVPAYTAFERTHRVPKVRIDQSGAYVIEAR
jgi:murein L,D-transpeptidase YafK